MTMVHTTYYRDDHGSTTQITVYLHANDLLQLILIIVAIFRTNAHREMSIIARITDHNNNNNNIRVYTPLSDSCSQSRVVILGLNYKSRTAKV